MQFDVGGFIDCGVLTGSFSERLGIGGGIEDVIDDLKGEPEVASGGAQGRTLAFISSSDESAQHQRGLNHGGGLVEVNKFKIVGRGCWILLGEEIFHLAADQMFAAGGSG